MNNKNSIIKSELLALYKNGKTRKEAHEEISKSYSSYEVSLSTVNKWFEIFKSKVTYSIDYIVNGSKKKFTDEYLASLVKDNPNLNTAELASLIGVTQPAISIRLKQIKNSGENIKYCKKSHQKFTDEYIIDLVNKNPNLTVTELSRIAGTSSTTIYRRIKKINSDGTRVSYVKKPPRLNRNGRWETNPKLEDEYLIKLINNNPDLSMEKLATLTDSSQPSISRRIKQINRHGVRVNYQRKNGKKFSDKLLVDLVRENPDFNQIELTVFTNTSNITISNRINEIDKNGISINYCRKPLPKFTDEYLINLINENPDLNMGELGKLAGTSALVISRRIRKIASSGVKINYTHKKTQRNIAESYESPKQNPKLTDEYLIDLTNQNPDLNLVELAKLAGTSSTTISRRIRQAASRGVKINYTNKKTKKSIAISNEEPRQKIKFTDET